MFEAINYLLFEKNKKELDNEILSSFVPYMTNRYLSFYNNEYVTYVNETLNSYGDIFNSIEDKFKFYDNIIPKLKKKRIQYIKKPKVEISNDESPIPEFYSKREIELLTNRLYKDKS